jgi:hypothetical protein
MTWPHTALLPLAVVAAACGGGTAPGEPEPAVRPDTAAAVVDTAVAAPAREAEEEAGAGEVADTGEEAGREGAAEGAAEEAAEAAGEAAGEGAGEGAADEAREAAAAADSAALVLPADSALAAPAALPVPILPGALLPGTRIVAFYGNPASEHMGILGELPPDEMLARLDAEVEAWRAADPDTPVRPALQMIAVMATGDPGRDSLYRLRMPDHRIEQVAAWAGRRDALLFLDVQPGRSTVPDEVQPLEPWLRRPDVHLALDPEWAMPDDAVPGQQIGSLTADDINWAIDYLADLVERHHLPPKVLVVHRFTTSMIRRATEIRRDPRVQVVINMDGWGSPPQKRAAYRDIVAPESDQFTGFKLFFRNDRRDGSVLLTPAEILELEPVPIYIQYQ